MTELKSCSNCPSFLGANKAAEQQAIYGLPLGIPVCQSKGHILGSNGMEKEDEVSLQNEVAEKCNIYGKKPETSRIQVGLHLGVGAPPDPPSHAGLTKSCRTCFFYMDSQRMQTAVGVGAGLCTKFGKMIPDTKCSEIARQCGSGRQLALPEGQNMEDHYSELLQTFVVAPRLASRMLMTGILAEKQPVQVREIKEPGDYQTDQPVSSEHMLAGIKAWRRVTNGKHETFLPIFRKDFFAPDLAALIPVTGEDAHPEEYVDHMNLAYKVAVLWRELDETPALYGVPGTGKTEFFRYMAWLMQLPFHRISVTKHSEIDDLAGKTEFSPDKGTFFRHGRIPLAWNQPCVLVLDEPNVGPPEVWQFIRPLTDNSKQLVLDGNAGEVIVRDDHCYMGMAMNPAWDMRNAGAEPLAAADGSRLMHIFVGFPSEKIEKNIIKARCEIDGYQIPVKTLSTVMKVAEQLRKLDEDLPITWGIREQIKVARATRWFDIEEAYRLAACDFLDPAEQDQVLDVVRANKSE